MYIAKTAILIYLINYIMSYFFPKWHWKWLDSVLQTDSNSNGESNYGH